MAEIPTNHLSRLRIPIALFLILLCTGCTVFQKNSERIITETCNEVESNPFVREAWPNPGASVTQSEYNQLLNSGAPAVGVGVAVDNRYLICGRIELYKLSDYTGKNQPGLVELYLNGVRISNDQLIKNVIATKLAIKDNNGNVLCEGSPEIDYFWKIELPKGKYKAEMLITTSTGTCLKYSWTFDIV